MQIFSSHKIVLWIPVMLIVAILAGCNLSEPPQPKLREQPFKICMGGILAPLPFIAKEKGFFKAEGIAAEILLLGDGKAAMSGFLEGKCDACLSGEFPVVRLSFERKDLLIIATLSSSDNAVKILARKDRGINAPADLVGKKIGVSKGTISNFFLDQFLSKNKIPRDKLTIVDISHQSVGEALKLGDIDAFAGSDVAYLKGRKLIEGKGVTFAEPGLTNHFACLTVKREWLAANPELAKKLLKALVAAERQLSLYPEEVASMLAERLNVQTPDLKSVMDEQHNMVSIDQVLILAMEDEARWMQENRRVRGGQLPNYLHSLDPAILKSVNPSAVKLW